MFKLTTESKPATYFSYETDSSTWSKLARGYNYLFDIGLSKLLSYGFDEDEVDNIMLLRQFIKEIEEKLNEKRIINP
jgi:hypothetical protein